MKSTAIAAVVAAATLGFSTLSLADGPDRRGRGHDGPRYEQRQDRLEARRDLQEARRDMREARRDLRENRRARFDQRHVPRYNAHRPHFYRGGHLPHEYRGRQHVVQNWQQHHLYAPPQGHQWMQVNGDYLLIAAATGIIASLLLAN